MNTCVKRLVFQKCVYLIDLNPIIGSEQGGVRPCVCVSNNKNNICSNTALFIPLTSRVEKNQLPTHYLLLKDKYNFLTKNSIVLTEQLTCKSIKRVKSFLGKIDDTDLEAIQQCIRIQLGIEG